MDTIEKVIAWFVEKQFPVNVNPVAASYTVTASTSNVGVDPLPF